MLKSTYTPPPPLPPGWTEHRAPTGHLYYYNTATKQSTYTRPQIQTPQPAPVASSYSPETLPPFSSTPYGPAGYQPSGGQHGSIQPEHRHGRGGFRGGRGYQDRGRREPQDRPKTKHVIPNCAPWVLVKTKLGRRFVHNPDTNESFWKFPQELVRGVIEYDRLEREKKEKIERGEKAEEARKVDEPTETSKPGVDDAAGSQTRTAVQVQGGVEDSDEYEEVEVTDSEDEDGQPSKRARTESEGPITQPVEFTEEDMEYQLAAMGEEYGLDPGEYGEVGEGDWDDETQGLPLTDADADALFRDLLDDYSISPFTTWEKIIEEGRIVEDPRYTAPSNMKARREIFSNWSRDRAKDVQERKKKQEKQDPRIKYFALLQEYATPKLYWPEFKRKYRKEPEMKDSQLHDKDREKFYREYISKLKAPESSRKSDLAALLKSAPLHALNRSSSIDSLPTLIITDIRYIAVPPKSRDPLIEAFISTLPPAPEEQLTPEQQEELDRKRREREKREKALAEREKRVEEDKRRQRGELLRGKHLLREGEAEIAGAMRINKDGLRSHMEVDDTLAGEQNEQD